MNSLEVRFAVLKGSMYVHVKCWPWSFRFAEVNFFMSWRWPTCMPAKPVCTCHHHGHEFHGICILSVYVYGLWPIFSCLCLDGSLYLSLLIHSLHFTTCPRIESHVVAWNQIGMWIPVVADVGEGFDRSTCRAYIPPVQTIWISTPGRKILINQGPLHTYTS